MKEDYAKRVSAEGLKEAISEYGGEITIPDELSYEKMDIYQVEDRNQVSINFNLWINSVESDLTLIVSIVETQKDKPKYTIDDLRVL